MCTQLSNPYQERMIFFTHDTKKGVAKMKRYQTGELILVVMVVILAVMWLGSGRVGMMGYGGGHAEKFGDTAQQDMSEPPQSSAPKEPSEPQR